MEVGEKTEKCGNACVALRSSHAWWKDHSSICPSRPPRRLNVAWLDDSRRAAASSPAESGCHASAKPSSPSPSPPASSFHASSRSSTCQFRRAFCARAAGGECLSSAGRWAGGGSGRHRVCEKVQHTDHAEKPDNVLHVVARRAYSRSGRAVSRRGGEAGRRRWRWHAFEPLTEAPEVLELVLVLFDRADARGDNVDRTGGRQKQQQQRRQRQRQRRRCQRQLQAETSDVSSKRGHGPDFAFARRHNEGSGSEAVRVH